VAKVAGRALSISTKASIEICNTLRKKELGKAKTLLKEVIDIKTPIKFTRFTNGAGHKKGMGAGRYPKRAAEEILKLLESIEANAQFKGLNTSSLIIKHICAHNAGNVWRYGRHRRRKMKRTTVEIIVEEGKKKPEATKAADKGAEAKKVSKEDKSKVPQKADEKKEEKKTVTKEESAKKEAPKQEAKKEPIKEKKPVAKKIKEVPKTDKPKDVEAKK